MSPKLQIPRATYEGMLAHAIAECPNECVGMLVGQPESTVVDHYPLVNALASPTRFISEPKSQLAVERACRERGLQILAVYHSHPTSLPVPSRVDLDPEVNYWLGTEVLSVIISLMDLEPVVRAYRLWDGGYEAITWAVSP